MTTIDVHAHFIPDTYRKALSEAGIGFNDLGFPLPPWSVDSRLADMDHYGVATAVLSLSSPSLRFWHGSDAVKLARRLNDELASIVRNHPKRFGSFATLPMPDVQASLKEIACAFDELKMDGVVFMTNYDGIYLGDPQFAPVLDELDRRKAVAFVHPTHSVGALQLSLGYPPPMIEFPFDTTRTIVSLLDSDAIGRFPNVRFIASHGGGTLPFLAQRLEALLPWKRHDDPLERATKIREQIATLYFDLAGVAHRAPLAAINAAIDPSQLMMGFDQPFMTTESIAEAKQNIKDFAGFSDEQRDTIDAGTARTLFPRFATAPTPA